MSGRPQRAVDDVFNPDGIEWTHVSPGLAAVRRTILLSVVGVVAAAGAALFLVAPPFATHPFLGPWLAIPAACLAEASCMVAAVRVRSGPRPSRAGR
jgi:hypothetical protein